MKVLKFGSASIATASKIKSVAQIATKGQNDIIVLSSMRGTSESLAEISNYLYKKNNEGANEIINKLESDYLILSSNLYDSKDIKEEAIGIITSTFDYIRTFTKDLFTLFEERIVMAQGELLCSEIFNLYLKEKRISAILLSALDFMRTDKNSSPDPAYIKEKLNLLIDNQQEFKGVFVTQGYICRNAYGEIDDLRKGGSDYTASLIGAAVSAEEVQIWTDVNVMLNNDARYVEKPKIINQLSFDEAAELTYFGAKILHPQSILPAKMANIPVLLKNTEIPDALGTVISNKTEQNTIKAVAAKDNITAIKIKSGRMLLAYGFLRKIFEVFEDYQTSIDMLTTSEVGVSLTIDNDRQLHLILDDLKKYGTVTVESDMVIICVVGDLDWNNVGFQNKILEAVKDIPLRMVSYGGSNYNFSFLVKKTDKKDVLERLNGCLF